MCGIVGYIGPRDATPILLSGLKRLEYRGYDSAGLAVLMDGRIEVRREAGKLNKLVELVQASPVSGSPGIGHTRWATHGVPTARNAHPHLSANGRVVVVHNGIVENFLELRDELTAEGVQFSSDTDTEVIVQLVEKQQATGLGLLMSTFMDSQIGRVLDALDATGRRGNTITVLWSDNAWHLGEKAMTGKTSLWDRSTHVPLIFAGPGAGQFPERRAPKKLSGRTRAGC